MMPLESQIPTWPIVGITYEMQGRVVQTMQ